ncbi:MAG: agmatinase [Desulfofustis sp.]|nr:agmatinase [Desulfofustis sp.]
MAGAELPGFLASELTRSEAADSLFHVIPVPLEQSVSYGGGTGNGPAAIVEASQQLEAFDGISQPLDLGIHTTTAIECRGSIEAVLARIAERCSTVLAGGHLPVLLGGEHTVTLGALQAITTWSPSAVGLFQLDAHADLRDRYEGNRLSHACVARRAHQDLGMPLFQFGVRARCLEEERYRREHSIPGLDAATLHRDGLAALQLPADFPEAIYLSLDVDGLDPSVIRATGTPVPGGPGWYDTLAAIETVVRGRRVVGFDVVELAPQVGDHASSFAAAQLVYAVMGLIERNRSFSTAI